MLMTTDDCVLSSGQGGIGDLPINGVNQMASDDAGGIVFGTSDIEKVIKGETTRPAAIYRLAGARKLVPLADNIGF